MTTATDAEGVGRFENVPEGAYHVFLDATNGEQFDVNVSNHVDPKFAIWMKWPNLPVVTARRASGLLQVGCRGGAICNLDAGLTLFAARDLRQLATARASGSFDFGAQPPGLYFLRLSRNEEGNDWSPQGDIALEIDPQSPNPEFMLDVGMTSCGMYYSHDDCDRSELALENACGQVVDPVGAAIGNATISFADPAASKLLDTARTNSDGSFNMTGTISDGKYMLIVSAPGFTTLRKPITLRKMKSCVFRTTIQLGVSGTCSKAVLP